MQRSKRSSVKSRHFSKSKSTSKVLSKKSSKSNVTDFNFRYSNSSLKKIILIQKNWKKYYKRKIEHKIIKIQSLYRGYSTREIFDEVFILNKKLECFFNIIKITMFRHAMNFDYLANKRIEYYSDHKNTKHFLLLQRRVRYFLFMKKIKILNKKGIFNNIYIKTKEYRTKIKSKMTSDKYLAKPIYKCHRPLSKIIMIQRNYIIHSKMMKKLNKEKINKFSLNKCPLITKEERHLNREITEDNTNVKNKVIINKKDFYTKINYNYRPLLLIQKKYKERFAYLKENYRLKKHSKLLKKVNNKHHYIYHSYVINGMYEVLLIQKNIKYFLFKRHSMVNLLKKAKIKKCEIKKNYEVRVNVKKYFYEEFIRRLIIIIRKFFLSIYLKILKKHHKVKKISPFGLNDYNFIDSVNTNESIISRRRSSITSESNKIQKIKPQKKNSRKDTSGISPTKISNSLNKQSSLINNYEMKNIRERHSKKKVTFKNDTKSNKKGYESEGRNMDYSPQKSKKSSNKGGSSSKHKK